MNLTTYLLCALCINIMFADTNNYIDNLAQNETKEKKISTEDEETENEEMLIPIDFKDEYLVTINMGSSIPFGSNLKSKFTPGMNLSFDVLTPFGFTLLNKDFKVSAGLDMISCTAKENRIADNEGNQYSDYSATNIGTKLVTNISIVDISVGTGLAISSGTEMNLRDSDGDGVDEYNTYDMTTAYVSAGMSYTLPLSKLFKKIDLGNINFDVSNLTISFFGEGLMIMGAPAEEGTSDIINAGISIGYPILF